MPDDLRIRYRLLLAEAMYELSPEDRVAAIQDLKGLWEWPDTILTNRYLETRRVLEI